MKPKVTLPALSSDEINKIDEFRKSKQTAVLAILFSDIENSTFATEKLGEHAFSKLRHIHDELFIRIMTRDNSGKIVKEIGDSFLCVFSEPSTAVLRAIEFQNAIHSNKENLTIDGFTLKVKIGIHIGQVAVENNFALDIFGRHVNRASRIQSIANGGQILTSQSIWENAVGWLKNHNDINIRWIYYGKTKLKGINESVNIYCFYSPDTSKPTSPAIFTKKKQRNWIAIVASLILLTVASILSVEKIAKMKKDALIGSQFQLKKSYYVQFDFSKLQNPANTENNKSILDTASIQEKLLSQLIAVFNPDSIITEQDLIKQYSKNGTLYIRHENHSNHDSNYFRDTLSFFGSLFISVKEVSMSNHDSLALKIRMDMYPEKEGSTASERKSWFSVENIETPFRNLIQDMLMSTSTKSWIVQAHVTNHDDKFVFFRLTNDASLRVGASIKFMHEYIGIDGLKQRSEDLKKRIAYYTENRKDSVIARTASEELERIERDLSNSHIQVSFAYGIDIKGKVIELYDSTGKATWNLNNEFPERLRNGDLIYLAF